MKYHIKGLFYFESRFIIIHITHALFSKYDCFTSHEVTHFFISQANESKPTFPSKSCHTINLVCLFCKLYNCCILCVFIYNMLFKIFDYYSFIISKYCIVHETFMQCLTKISFEYFQMELLLTTIRRTK